MSVQSCTSQCNCDTTLKIPYSGGTIAMLHYGKDLTSRISDAGSATADVPCGNNCSLPLIDTDMAST